MLLLSWITAHHMAGLVTEGLAHHMATHTKASVDEADDLDWSHINKAAATNRLEQLN